jgi:chitinase
MFTEGYKQIVSLKERNPYLKVLISVGGEINAFSDVGSTEIKRKQLSQFIFHFLIQNGFDGIDLDWKKTEHPPGNPPNK